MKYMKINFFDDIKINLLEGLGILFLNVIVMCLEVIILISSFIQSQRLVDVFFVYVFYCLMKIEFLGGLFVSYNLRDGFVEFGFDNSNLFFDLRDMIGNFQLN